eukprot:TRINITY_DN294_c0_g1_i2.p2 TRINITY_DN294_c0_g1~~TRINITY_DN294_c0_g1_i2.p2  ORF type:complete len:75 (+),score=13.50 TRINITY_DN294_c0_g1_i2:130-354(+)
MTSKKGNKNYYKGRGARTLGKYTSKGFRFEPEKVPEIVVPDLTGFELLPYVARNTPRGTLLRQKQTPSEVQKTA